MNIETTTKGPRLSYYRFYRSLKGLGLTTEQAVRETNNLFIGVLNGQ